MIKKIRRKNVAAIFLGKKNQKKKDEREISLSGKKGTAKVGERTTKGDGGRLETRGEFL